MRHEFEEWTLTPEGEKLSKRRLYELQYWSKHFKSDVKNDGTLPVDSYEFKLLIDEAFELRELKKEFEEYRIRNPQLGSNY